ncbi:unnamed protein product, partial [Prorocentrum cordatum]
EAEVTQVLWELYDHLYETYAIYAGRSQWPLVRHVDVYAFFDEAKLLQANLPIAASMALAAGEVRPKGRASDSEEGPALNEEGLVREITARTPLQLASGHGTILLQDVKLILMQTRAKGGTGQQDGACAGQLSASRQRRTEIAHQQAIEGAPITRPQFIEMLARTAIATRSDNPPVAVALRSFVDCVLARHVFRAPLARFPRGLQCQPGEVRDKLLAGRKTLLEAWERYGGSEVSFQRFAQLLRINDQHFTAKHVASVYALARQPDPARHPAASVRGAGVQRVLRGRGQDGPDLAGSAARHAEAGALARGRHGAAQGGAVRPAVGASGAAEGDCCTHRGLPRQGCHAARLRCSPVPSFRGDACS